MPVNEPFRKMDEVLQKLFSGERILQNFGKCFLEFGLARAEEGSGEESARASAFLFLAGRALRNQNTNIKISAKPRYKIIIYFLYMLLQVCIRQDHKNQLCDNRLLYA